MDEIDKLIQSEYEISYLCCYVNAAVHVIVRKRVLETTIDNAMLEKLITLDINCGSYSGVETNDSFYYNKLKEKLIQDRNLFKGENLC